MDDNSCIRALALAVIACAIRDRALHWLASEDCRLWCDAAQIDHAALLERLKRVVV